jgi:two-component system, NarL family, nitrate/nitrite response regulator NarL
MGRIESATEHVRSPAANGNGQGPTLRVLIVDDHLLFAEAIRVALEDGGLSVVGTISIAAEALGAVGRLEPDVILMDLALPDQSGLATGQAILERHPEAKIVAVTALNDRSAVDEALRIGFRGYLTKDTPVAQFVTAVRSAIDGHLVLPHRLSPARRRSEAESDAALLASQLTPREREVLALLVQGADGKKAAAILGISLNTVRTHVQCILTKLQVHSRLEAATFAVRHRLVDIPSPEGADYATALPA